MASPEMKLRWEAGGRGPIPEELRALEQVDGWYTASAEFFRYIVGHSIPRPSYYGKQLLRDVKSWKPWVLWAVSLGSGARRPEPSWKCMGSSR